MHYLGFNPLEHELLVSRHMPARARLVLGTVSSCSARGLKLAARARGITSRAEPSRAARLAEPGLAQMLSLLPLTHSK